METLAYLEFASTCALDELHTTDYAWLEKLGHVYLDYSGGGRFASTV